MKVAFLRLSGHGYRYPNLLYAIYKCTESDEEQADVPPWRWQSTFVTKRVVKGAVCEGIKSIARGKLDSGQACLSFHGKV